MSGATVLRFLLFPALLAGFAAAAVWTVRLACADYWFRQQTVRGTEKALAFTPGQADYYVRLALLEPDRNQQKAALKQAIALNPSDAPAWIELGLRYEQEGNRPLAEQCLLRAAEEDAEYLPRWTLANYYFRTNQVDRFWLWAKNAAGMVYGDPAPLFRLCGRVEEDGALIDRLNLKRADVQAAYLSYLLNQGRLDLIGPASRHLLHGTGVLHGTRASDVPLLLAACDRLLESKNVSKSDSKNVVDALEIWNGLAEVHRIPFGPLQPAEGRVLTNGDFRVPPTTQGFDWRLPAIDGVSASADEGGGLRLTFSGNQPESCELLAQWVPIQQNMDHELKFEYQTHGIAAGSGLEWHITDPNGGSILADTHSLSSESGGSGKISFVTPVACRLARVSLAYRRVPGTTRIDGFVVLRKVVLKPTTRGSLGHFILRTFSVCRHYPAVDGILQWYAVRVRPKGEVRASDELSARDFEPFLPTLQVKRRWSDRVKTLAVPVFPGYLFCRFRPAERARVLDTPAVIQILGIGATPIPVSDAEIEAIQTVVTSRLPLTPWPYLRSGQRVRIERGPLAGIEGIVAKAADGKPRVVVSVTLLQRSVAAEIERDWVGLIEYSSFNPATIRIADSQPQFCT